MTELSEKFPRPISNENHPVRAKLPGLAIRNYFNSECAEPLDLDGVVFRGGKPFLSEGRLDNYIHVSGSFDVPLPDGGTTTYGGQLSFRRGIVPQVLELLGKDLPVAGHMYVPTEHVK